MMGNHWLPSCMLGVLAFWVATPPAFGAPPRRKPQRLVMMHGQCQSLIVYGTDITDRCDGKVGNADYSDGRNSFTFISTDRAVVITFSGDGKRQVHPDANTAVQPLDAVLARFNGKTDTIRSGGTCRFTNPYKGKAPVQCRAETPQGEFSANFLSDGQAPDIKDLR